VVVKSMNAVNAATMMAARVRRMPMRIPPSPPI
jgi:hypothetical protein